MVRASILKTDGINYLHKTARHFLRDWCTYVTFPIDISLEKKIICFFSAMAVITIDPYFVSTTQQFFWIRLVKVWYTDAIGTRQDNNLKFLFLWN
jgi:hypothetical protein